MNCVLKRIPERMYSQYADKPKFVNWLAIARKMGGSFCDAIEAVRNSYDVDTATGEQLDVIGRIVVIDRGFLNHIDIDYCEFASDDDPLVPEFGSPDAFFSESSIAADDQMSDGLYRLLIKSKIIKNNGDATIESIIRQMIQLVAADFVRVNDTDDMQFSVEFSSENITDLQRYALFNADIVQRPQGVQFNGFFELIDIVEFASENDPEVWEFGNERAEFSNITGGL